MPRRPTKPPPCERCQQLEARVAELEGEVRRLQATRDETICALAEHVNGLLAQRALAKKPRQHGERDAEIVSLHYAGMTPAKICEAIRDRWPTTERGRTINPRVVAAVLRRNGFVPLT